MLRKKSDDSFWLFLQIHVIPSWPLCSWFCLSSVRHLPYVFRRKSIGFSLFLALSLRVNNVAFVYWSGLQAWWISFLIVYFWKPFSRVYPLQPFPYVRRQLICLFSTEHSVGNYWYIWSRLPHIWPSHSWVPAAYEYSPSDVYLYWKPWTRCVRWTICRLSVCCLTLEAFFFLFLL